MLINKDILLKTIPKYPQIEGSEDFIQTSVLVLLLKKDNKWNILFEKRAKTISQGGEISFPGGKFDKKLDKTAEDTAIRETIEEIHGINPENIEIIGELNTIVAPIGVIIKPFLAISEIKEKVLSYNKNEVEYIFSVPLNWFLENQPKEFATVLKAHPYIFNKNNEKIQLLPIEELNLPSRYNKPWGNLKQKVFVYNYNDEIIWGLTARIVNSLIKKLFKN